MIEMGKAGVATFVGIRSLVVKNNRFPCTDPFTTSPRIMNVVGKAGGLKQLKTSKRQNTWVVDSLILENIVVMFLCQLTKENDPHEP